MNLSARLESIAARFDAWAKTADAHAREAADDRLLAVVLEHELRAVNRRECAATIREAVAKLTAKEKRGAFVPPSVDEVAIYAAEKHPHLPKDEVERFWLHHDSRSWISGKTPLTKWKSALGTWVSIWRKSNTAKRPAANHEKGF